MSLQLISGSKAQVVGLAVVGVLVKYWVLVKHWVVVKDVPAAEAVAEVSTETVPPTILHAPYLPCFECSVWGGCLGVGFGVRVRGLGCRVQGRQARI